MSNADKTEFNEQIRQDEQMDFQTKFALLHQTLDEQRRLLQKVRILGKDAWKDEPLPKKKMGEVFSDIQDSLYDLQFADVTADDYWELVNTFKDLFVEFWYDEEHEMEFQVFGDEKYVISRANLQAKPYTGTIPESAIRVNRKYAERMEDNWAEEYDRQHKAEDTHFETYIAAVKEHLRGILQNMPEEELDQLLSIFSEQVGQQYVQDMERLRSGQISEDVFLTESPAIAADALIRLVSASNKN